MSKPKYLSFSSPELMPQEEMLEVGKRSSRLNIGIPKETSLQEKRVGLVPDAVHLLVNNGHEVTVESGAGLPSNFSDNDFSEAGAKISYSTEEVFRSDIVLKVAPPSLKEMDYMQPKQTLISALQLKVQNKAYFEKLTKKKISAIAYDYIQDEEGVFPVVRSMSEIAGNTAILIAAELMSNVNDGKGLMLGGISGVSPTEVVILGAGTVGEYAARAAMGLGATIKMFDNSLNKLRRIQDNLNARIYTSIVQPKVLQKALMRADVVIGAIRAEGRTPCIVTEEMVQNMKAGSVIVDVSIDQGGCIETSEITTHDKPTINKFDVIHYGVPNIASRVARTASFSLSNIFAPILLSIGEEGGVENMLRRKKGVRCGMYIYNGVLTNRGIGDWYGMPHRDINLLFGGL